MKLKQLIFALILTVAGAFGAVQAQTQCISSGTLPYSYSNVPGGSGSISIAYQLCYPSLLNATSFYMSSTMTYNNVSFDGSFKINGSMNMQLNFANSAFSSITFSGGPLTFTVSGQPYTVTFNNLAFALSSTMKPSNPTGSLTINGTNYPADVAYFGFLFR